MGRDKAAITIEGVAMAERVARALRAAGARDVLDVGRDVADRYPGEGPLGGIITALSECPSEIVVVAPCDLLAPEPAAFSALVAVLEATPDAAVAAPTVQGRRQPFPSAWRSETALEPLEAAFARGERSPVRALDELDLVEVVLAPEAVADADVPSDLPPGTR